MDSLTYEYKDILIMRKNIMEKIYDNTLAQTKALEEDDNKLLKRLSKRRRKLIDEILKVKYSSNMEKGSLIDEETLELEQLIKSLWLKIRKANDINIQKAGKLKREMERAICHLRCGKNAIQNGYYKRVPQQYGYFIDKKVGK